jgi:signal transduction histidine kinase
VFVVVSSYFYNRLRYSEFALRYELDKNRKQLEESNQRLLELGQVKDRFFANISHELRTPLTLLISPLEILLFQKGALLTEEQKALAQMMHANAMRLLKMINDLLDLVRLEAGRMEVKQEPAELTELSSLNSATRQVRAGQATVLADAGSLNWRASSRIATSWKNLSESSVQRDFQFTSPAGRQSLPYKTRFDQLIITDQRYGVGIS